MFQKIKNKVTIMDIYLIETHKHISNKQYNHIFVRRKLNHYEDLHPLLQTRARKTFN